MVWAMVPLRCSAASAFPISKGQSGGPRGGFLTGKGGPRSVSRRGLGRVPWKGLV